MPVLRTLLSKSKGRQARITARARWVANKVAKLVARTRVHPTALTLAGLGFILVAAVIWTQQDRWAPAAWLAIVVGIIGALFDGIDGAVAREAKKVTVFGGELDSITDRVVETIIFAALAETELHSWLAAAFVAAAGGSVTVSYIRTRAEKRGLKGDVGLGQRMERLVLMAVLILLSRYHWWLSHYTRMLGGIPGAIYVLNALVWWTVFSRIQSLRVQLRVQEAKLLAEGKTQQ